MSKFHQGSYIPINKEKCLSSKVPFLSSWEHTLYKVLDANPSVKKWDGNKLNIQYYNPVKRRMSKYFLDAYFENVNKNGILEKFIVEIKPDVQIFPPNKPKRMTAKSLKNYNYNILQYSVNISKWTQSQQFALTNGFKFLIMSEKGIYTFNQQPIKISNKGFF